MQRAPGSHVLEPVFLLFVKGQIYPATVVASYNKTEHRKQVQNRTDYNGWEKLKPIGKGGQGEVFRVRKTHLSPTVPLDRLMDAVQTTADRTYAESRQAAAKEFVLLIRQIVEGVIAEDHAKIGALKILHPNDDEAAEKKAQERLRREIAAMQKHQHPCLVKIFEANLEEKWFVMEYFSHGMLSGQLDRFRGDVLGSLCAIRPLVEAVSEIHKNGSIHRDIKPDNIFIADDNRLVLGDFGLIIDPSDDTERLSGTNQNVGSRDWMPPWAMGMRVDNIKPSFDVFSLGNVFWNLVSGEKILRLHYFDNPEHNVEQMFPKSADMKWATRILKKCVVEHETDCLQDAGALLEIVDEVINVLKHGGQLLRKDDPIRCVICAGECRLDRNNSSPDCNGYECSNCGYRFYFSGVNRKAWE